MKARVYRNANAQNTFLGLAFPSETLIVLCVAWISMLTIQITLALVSTLACYVAVRVLGHGRPEDHLQHWLNWKLRQHLARGVLSAGARARTPRFPRGPYLYRDVGRQESVGPR